MFTNNHIGPSLQEIAIENVLQREHQLQEEEKSRRIQSNGSDDVSLWARHMQWDKTFDETKDLRVSSLHYRSRCLANRSFPFI